MIPQLQSAGLQVLFWVGVFILFLLYISRIKTEAKKDGALEKTLDYINKKRKTINEALKAEREFGTVWEDIDDDDTKKLGFNHKYFDLKQEVILDDDIANNYIMRQFKDSPNRN